MNLINDNWLFVRYNDGSLKQVSIRQAFQDAEIIKTIETPTFHGTKVYIYDVPVMQLLTTILLSAYFKPETNFIAKDEYFQEIMLDDGEYDVSVILSYLDKWQDRFNLFDEKYPFLQDTRLKPYANFNTDNIEAYLPKISLMSPNGDNKVFEKCTPNPNALTNYKPDMTELIYILLYNQAMGASPNADNYPNKTLSANASMFVVNYKDNLKNTLFANALPLRSSATGEQYDRPIWELDDRMDVLIKFDASTIFKNVLLCTFFPSLPMYIAYADNEVKDIKIAQKRVSDDCIFDRDIKAELTKSYVLTNPIAIKGEFVDKDTKELVYRYVGWNTTIRLIRLCIDVTKQTAIGELCPILSLGSGANTVIYYREWGNMNCEVLSFGKYELPQSVFTTLTNPNNHEKAVQFQNIINKVVKECFPLFKDVMNDTTVISIQNKAVSHSSTIDETIATFNSFAEHYFFTDFVNNIANEDALSMAYDSLIKKAKTMANDLCSVAKNPMKFADKMSLFYYKLKKLQEEVNGQ